MLIWKEWFSVNPPGHSRQTAHCNFSSCISSAVSFRIRGSPRQIRRQLIAMQHAPFRSRCKIAPHSAFWQRRIPLTCSRDAFFFSFSSVARNALTSPSVRSLEQSNMLCWLPHLWHGPILQVFLHLASFAKHIIHRNKFFWNSFLSIFRSVSRAVYGHNIGAYCVAMSINITENERKQIYIDKWQKNGAKTGQKENNSVIHEDDI